ncbi:hypothetical protein BJ875DRAFT_457722, partial [Amylocarpus encephaloides]
MANHPSRIRVSAMPRMLRLPPQRCGTVALLINPSARVVGEGTGARKRGEGEREREGEGTADIRLGAAGGIWQYSTVQHSTVRDGTGQWKCARVCACARGLDGDAWCVVRGVWCVACGVWSVVCGLWSVVFGLGVWSWCVVCSSRERIPSSARRRYSDAAERRAWSCAAPTGTDPSHWVAGV